MCEPCNLCLHTLFRADSSNKYPKVPRDATWTDPRDTPLAKRYEGKVWKGVMQASKKWSERHERISRNLDKITESPLECDLDGNAVAFVIVDDGGRGQFAMLTNALTRHLRQELPSIAIKTGCSRKRPLGFGDPSTLEVAADMASSGTPVVFLDVRTVPRGAFDGVLSREMMISRAKQLIIERNRELRASGRKCDTLDVCMVSFFHEVLTGDGDPSTEEMFPGGFNDDTPTPLHRAIALRLKSKRQTKAKVAAEEIGQPGAAPGADAPGVQEAEENSSGRFSLPLSVMSGSFRKKKDSNLSGLAPSAAARSVSGVHVHESDGGRVRVSPTSPPRRSQSPFCSEASQSPQLHPDMGRSSEGVEHDDDAEDENWRDEPATQQQQVAVSDWLTDQYFRQGWELLSDHAERVERGESFDVHGRKMYKDPMLAMSVACRTLLSSENLCEESSTPPRRIRCPPAHFRIRMPFPTLTTNIPSAAHVHGRPQQSDPALIDQAHGQPAGSARSAAKGEPARRTTAPTIGLARLRRCDASCRPIQAGVQGCLLDAAPPRMGGRRTVELLQQRH